MPDITAARPVAGQPIETAWGDQVHDTIEGIPTIRNGIVTIPATTGQIAVAFASAYNGTPSIVLSPVWGGLSALGVSSPTASGFTIVVRGLDGAVPTTDIACNWLASGILA
jgi:hypothetical protein